MKEVCKNKIDIHAHSIITDCPDRTFVGFHSPEELIAKYDKYGIEKKETNYDEEYTMTGFYSLRLTHEEEPFELLFPLFDAVFNFKASVHCAV